MTKVTHEFDLYGKHYTLEAGELAKQATGACIVSAAIPPYFSLQWFPRSVKITTSSH